MIRALVVAACFIPSLLHAQQAHPRYVVVDSSVRAMLAAQWDESNPHQHERAYCLAWVLGTQWGVPVYRVWAASPAEVRESSTNTITYRCPIGPQIVAMHVHPPTTCEIASDCHIGGPDAHQCFASPTDEFTLLRSGDPFHLIQCDRWALVPVWPHSLVWAP